MQTCREQVIEFLESQHQKTGKTPSIRSICKTFGLSNRARAVAKANQALKVKREKEQLECEELEILKQQEDEVAREVKQAQAIV